MVIVFVFFLIGIVSASFEIGNLSHSIDSSYAPEESVRGWINISLNNEPTISVFEDSEGNSISLINLLKSNDEAEYSDFEYSCNPIDCESDYTASNGAEIKTFDLDNKDSKIFGFKLEGEITDILSVNFTISSDADSSCYNQIELDFLNNGVIEKGNNKVSVSTCDFLKTNGCFNESKNSVGGLISEVPYCQRIKIPESPGFRLSAWIKKENQYDSRDIKIELYDLDGNSVESASCVLSDASTEWGGVYCDIDYLVTKSEDYYVCVYSESGDGEYKINGYPDSEGCGFHKTPTYGVTENAAYNISVTGKRFSSVGDLEITNSLAHSNTLSNDIFEYYIEKRYGRNINNNLDCVNGCVVPVRINSGADQTITLKDLSIKYDTTTLSGVEETEFYDLSETPAKINADFQKIYLNDGNLTLPSDYGEVDYELKLNKSKIFSKELVVEKVPGIEAIKPTITFSAYPTGFEVIVSSDANISSYEWDFGDTTTETSITNKIIHTYNSTGNYELKVTVIDSLGRSSYKIFTISVGSPEQVINSTIDRMETNLGNIISQISKFSEFTKESVENILDTDELNEKLRRAQTDFNSAETETEYNQVMTNLLDLNIPKSVYVSMSSSPISFYPDKDEINLEVLKDIGGGSYDESEVSAYRNSILAWNLENLDTKVSLEEITSKYEDFELPLVKIFKLDITEKQPLSQDPYLIIKKLDNMLFKENYLENEESGYINMELRQSTSTIVFSTTEDVDFVSLPAFISPSIDRLVLTEEDYEEGGKKKGRWAFFILVLFLLLIIGVVVYIILQEWYKKKYEGHLFKNKNSLYNLINYIGIEKKKGLKDKEIIVKLKKAGWNSEQIRYVTRKYLGKRTGMFEIPVGKVLSKFKKQKKVQQPVENKNIAGTRFQKKY